jgi:putative flippase GtrA
VTCPSLLQRPPATADLLAGLSHDGDRRAPGTTTRVLRRLRADDPAAQFGRFVLVGALSSLVYALLFLSLGAQGTQLANVVGAVASSVLANELHRRLTFHAEGQVDWFTAQWEGGGLALAGIVATTLALSALHALTGASGTTAQLLLVGVVTGAVGLVRFVALRWIFTPRRARQS